jgi:hypothetical protein
MPVLLSEIERVRAQFIVLGSVVRCEDSLPRF